MKPGQRPHKATVARWLVECRAKQEDVRLIAALRRRNVTLENCRAILRLIRASRRTGYLVFSARGRTAQIIAEQDTVIRAIAKSAEGMQVLELP